MKTVGAIVNRRTVMGTVDPEANEYIHAGRTGTVTQVNEKSWTVRLVFNGDEDGWYRRDKVTFFLAPEGLKTPHLATGTESETTSAEKTFYVGDRVRVEGVVRRVDGNGIAVKFDGANIWFTLKEPEKVTLTESTFSIPAEPADGTIVRTKPYGPDTSNIEFWMRDDTRFRSAATVEQVRTRYPYRWYRIGNMPGGRNVVSWPDVAAKGVTVMVDE